MSFVYQKKISVRIKRTKQRERKKKTKMDEFIKIMLIGVENGYKNSCMCLRFL